MNGRKSADPIFAMEVVNLHTNTATILLGIGGQIIYCTCYLVFTHAKMCMLFVLFIQDCGDPMLQQKSVTNICVRILI